MSDTINALRQILVKDLFVEQPPDQIDPDAPLQSTYGLDSVAFLELRVAAEQQFSLSISDDDFSPEHFRTLNRLAKLIAHLQAARAVNLS